MVAGAAWLGSRGSARTLVSFALLVAAGTTIYYAVATIGMRPLEYTEGEVLFDAARIAHHLPLYTDVVAGAAEYGTPPSHHLVAYLPFYAWLVSLAPDGWAVTFGRVLSFTAWTAALAGIALGARPAAAPVARMVALYLFGTFVLAYWGTCARPDAVAVATAGVALALTVRRGRLGALSAALFTAAVLIKPNVLGAFGGAGLVELWSSRADRRGLVRAIAGSAVVAVPAAVALHVVSDGSWLHWLGLGTLQPFDLDLWQTRVGEKLPQFAPLLAAAGWCAHRARRSPGMTHALAALLASAGWSIAALGKVGSASNYWLEPSLVCLVIAANAPVATIVASTGARVRAWLVALAVLDVLGTAAVSAWYSTRDLRESRDRREVLQALEPACRGATLSDDAGLEMELDGRVIVSSFQLRWLVAAGQFPATALTDTIADPALACAVMRSDILERPAALERGWHDGLGTAARAAFKRRFTLVRRGADLWLYRARDQ